MTENVQNAIKAVDESRLSFCKFLSANDTGETGGHQSGIYIPKNSVSILFPEPGKKGEQKERWVKIKWQDDFFTDSRFIYYGQKTRNEYRITNFGRGFPFLRPEYTGALFVLAQGGQDDFKCYILNEEEQIQTFLDAFGITPAQTNCLLKDEEEDDSAEIAVSDFLIGLKEDFPSSDNMSKAARDIFDRVIGSNERAIADPDKILLGWSDMEYKLFKALEHERYGERIIEGFKTVDEFISMANKVLNRRKSRAGKSLEHHLSAIFDINCIQYTAQAVTEGNKKPDFLFPSDTAYHDFTFPESGLTTLAAKTTCKDRWRQILNEADRLRDHNKYLCTMQQGISGAQMDEMQNEKVILVVPKEYIKTYPKDRQERIWTVKDFVRYVKEKQSECI